MSTTQVAGLDELKKILLSLPAKIEKQVTQRALSAGARVLRDLAKENAPQDQGQLVNSIRVALDRKAVKAGVVRMKVIAGGKKAFHAHFVEYGTASYYAGTGRTVGAPYKIEAKLSKGLSFGGLLVQQVEHPGVKPQPFMRPAWDAGNAKALAATVAYFQKHIPLAVQKNGLSMGINL